MDQVQVEFSELGLSPETLRALEAKGFQYPTPIQELTIPLLLKGEVDVIGQAQTGTGKTAAFGLPIIERINFGAGKHVKAIILTPTRELAIQVAEEIESFRGEKRLSIVPIYGGQSMSSQLSALRRGVDIVVGTPGRVMDHMERGTLDISKIEFFVLDEADEMLNMGFVEDVEHILKSAPENKQMLFFSATMPDAIMRLATRFMRKHEVVAVRKQQVTHQLIDQICYEVRVSEKFDSLCRIIDIEEAFYGLVFCRTKSDVDEVTQRLTERGYTADGLHGDISQHQRERILQRFRHRGITILVATDVAARGIDIQDLTHVINYSLPQDPESYVHRVGRTGRAGKQGTAITFVTPSEYRKLEVIRRVTKTDIRRERLPKVRDIIRAKKARIVKEVRDMMAIDTELEDFMGVARGILEDSNPELALAALIKYSFRDKFNMDSYGSDSDAPDTAKRFDRPSEGRGGDRFERSDRGDRGGFRDRNDRGDRGERGGSFRDRDRGFGGERAGSFAGDRPAFGGAGAGDPVRERRDSGNRLFVALGKKDGYTKKTLVRLLEEEASVPSDSIQDVYVEEAFSFVSVAPREAEMILRAFKGRTGHGQKNLIEKAK